MPSKSDPKAIQKLDAKRQAINMLRQGMDTRTISEQLDVGEEYIRGIAREEMTYLSLEVQELQEHFVNMTYAQSMKIMSRIMPDFYVDPPEPPEDASDKEAVKDYHDAIKQWRRIITESAKNWALIVRVQKDVLQVRGPDDKKPGVNVEKMEVNNITLTTNTDMYTEALEHIQRDYLGESFPEMQARLAAEGDVIDYPYDDQLRQVEEAINKLHVTPDPDAGEAEADT